MTVCQSRLESLSCTSGGLWLGLAQAHRFLVLPVACGLDGLKRIAMDTVTNTTSACTEDRGSFDGVFWVVTFAYAFVRVCVHG